MTIKQRVAVALLALMLVPADSFARPRNIRITVSAGTPVQLSTLPHKVHSLLIQMRTGGSGVGYVLRVPPGNTPSASSGSDLSAELSAATSTAPGGYWADNDVTPQGTRKEIDLQWIWVDGANSGDTITVTYDDF